MHRWLAGGTVGFGVMILAGTLAAAPKSGTWLPDYAAAKALARQSGKPLLVVFR